LHYNVQAPQGADGAVFLREHEDEVNTWVFDQVKAFNGSISAEHGVGSLKADKLPHYKDPTALSMMKAIKMALDPQNIMNPGRVIKI
jgi:FAD/FMN-containing dehydrogenase